MLVFIDESGDAGFKFGKGSTQLFVVGMVIFESEEAAQRAIRRIERVAREMAHRPEFRFTNCRAAVRDEFFEQLSAEEFKVRALVVDKTKIMAKRLKRTPDHFYDHFLQLLLRQSAGILSDATIIIDGSGSREFTSNLRGAVRKLFRPGAVTGLRLKNSKSDRLVQLADMCVGSIYRAHREDDRRDTRWFDRLRPRIEAILVLK